MKKLLVLTLGLLLLAFSVVAFAKVQKFEHFSVDVPKDWKVQKEEGGVNLIAPDQSAIIGIGATPKSSMPGMTLEALVAQTMKALGAESDPAEEDGVYMISYTAPNGMDAIAIISEEDGMFVVINLVGEHDDMEAIVDSIE